MIKIKMLDVEEVMFEIKREDSKIDVAALKPEQYAENPYILNKYFRHNGRNLDRCHIPEIDAEAYAYEVSKLENVKDYNLKFDTASDYFKRKVRLNIMAKDFGVDVKRLNTRNYYWREDMYTCSDFWVNLDRVEEAYKTANEDERIASSNEVYIRQDPRTSQIEQEIYDSLFNLVWFAVKHRFVMLMQRIEPLIGALNNINEYTNGFSENCTRSMKYSLISYTQFFETLFSDKDFKEFIATNNDYTLYALDNCTRGDYIDTYRRTLQSISKGFGGSQEGLRDLLEDFEDEYIDEIVEDRGELVLKSFD